jgi:predicted Na+-dependent transporter
LSRIDGFLAAILLTVAFASLVPARGDAAMAAGWLTDAAIALLFFMHGAKISPDVAAAHDGISAHVRVVSAAWRLPHHRPPACRGTGGCGLRSGGCMTTS